MSDKRIIALGKGSNGGGGSTQWGQITGNISDQTDLQNELNNFPTKSGDNTLTGNNTFTGSNTFDEGGSISIIDPDNSTSNVELTSENIIIYDTVSNAQTEITPADIQLQGSLGGYSELDSYSLTFNTLNGNQLSIGISEEDDGEGNITGETYFTSQFDINLTTDNNININGDVVITTNNGIATIDGNNVVTDDQLATVATTGDYEDLINKPNIGNIWYGTQEQFDEIENSDLDYDTEYYIAGKLDYNTDIKNTPYIPEKVSDLNNDLQFMRESSTIEEIQNAVNYIKGLDKYLSREEYDALEQAGELEEDVNYHIEDTVYKLEMVVTFTDQSTATYNVYVEEPVQSSN